MPEVIGWLSSLILVLTIGKQVHKQWREGTSEGVSRWLFIGQCAASTGFTVYSALIHSWIFVVTNATMLISAIAGWLILARNKRRNRAEGRERPRPRGIESTRSSASMSFAPRPSA